MRSSMQPFSALLVYRFRPSFSVKLCAEPLRSLWLCVSEYSLTSRLAFADEGPIRLRSAQVRATQNLPHEDLMTKVRHHGDTFRPSLSGCERR